MTRPDPRLDALAGEGSKKRRVLDELADGEWHTGSQLHAAFGTQGWSWDGAMAQLRKTLRAKGGNIEGVPIPGRHEKRYRIVWPAQAELERHKERTTKVVEQKRRKPPVTSSGAHHGEREGRLF